MNKLPLRTWIAPAVLVAFALAGASCGDSTPTPPPTPTATTVPAPRVLSATASIREDNSLIAEVNLTLDPEAQAYVVYENEDAGRFQTLTTPEVATEHVVAVVRLRPSTTYSYQAFVVDSEGRESAGPEGKFTTGELPAALATIEFVAEGRPTSELVLIDHRDRDGGYYLVLDQDSRVVWYYQSPNPIADAVFGVQTIRQKPDYNFVYYLGRPPLPCCLREITPLGEVVDNLSFSILDGVPHHDHHILPDNQVVYLAWTYRVIDDSGHGGHLETVVEGDTIRIWDQKTGISREVWNAFDALGTDRRGSWTDRPVASIPGHPSVMENSTPIHWTFGSSMTIGPRGNYILSLKNLSQVVSVSPDFQQVEWSLGGPYSTYELIDPTDRPYNFHTVSELSNGNILIFDNGFGRPEEEGGEYSRVIELALSDYDLRVTKVWEYRPDPDIYSRLRGSAWRLDNGNTLVSFDTNPRHVVEVDPDAAEVWHLEMSGPRLVASYRAYALESIMGESPVP